MIQRLLLLEELGVGGSEVLDRDRAVDTALCYFVIRRLLRLEKSGIGGF